MSRLLWIGGWITVVLWSLFALAAYGVVDVVGGAAMRNADVFSRDPQTVESIFKMFSFLHGLSTSAILVAWGLVSLGILAVPWLFDRLTGPVARPPAPPRHGVGPGGNVIDLEPGQYQVVPPGRPGPVPRIDPRA